ncbi:hypothetical protein A3C67_01070 [Candidatus Nomurabacteria bacterium RIFCSPHIGHO2_02_FULL_42_19]|uniref:Peptidoglycan binding-like domain-containing protein n=1 Tax=Candidatus Nomurabacteria bacterium RIFCSPHIGHO2_02_FULL_42_19 TaxID=1801756 RepID=A0A1F6W223_9BACT|nr:MAG: hypothetical protein A3C67_01070 [Candidatus Nomurabacteria bacterium RIFCSPHIGHO2_02_FULL_42_19]
MIVAAVVVAFAMFATTALAYTQMGTLRVGSSGSQVVSLQAALGVGADGSFGPITKAAVMAFQSSHGLVADGVVGPLTGAALGGVASGGSYPAGCSSSSGYSVTTGLPCSGGGSLPAGCMPGYAFSSTTGMSCTGGAAPAGPLAGGTGSITLTASGSYSSENVGEGDEDIKVMAVEVEADNGSDVQLLSTKVEFIQDTAGDPKQIWKYASEVSVWFDGEKVGSADTDGFSKSGNYYSATIPLDGVIVRAGKKMELAFSVSAQSSLESTDIDTDDWNIDLINLRFQDADGIVISESGDAAATAGGTYAKTFDFDSFATATGASLTLTLEDDAINDVHLLDVDDVLDTSHAITSILMDASGSDIWVDEMVSTITTNGETDESVIVISTWIEVAGVRISDKEDVIAGGAVTYNDLDYTISAGDEEEWIFWVEMQDVNGDLDNGDDVQLTVDTSGTVAQDGSGDTLTAAGTDPVGGVHIMHDNGIRLVGNSQVATAFTIDGVNNDRVELELIFDVFNYGDVTLYIPDGDTLTGTPSTSATTTAPSTTQEVGYHIQTSGTVTPPSAQVSAVLTETDDDLTLETNAYELKSGKTGTFNLKVTISADENPSIDNVGFRALLAGLGWATSDVATAAVVYTANLGDYKTNYATIAD